MGQVKKNTGVNLGSSTGNSQWSKMGDNFSNKLIMIIMDYKPKNKISMSP